MRVPCTSRRLRHKLSLAKPAPPGEFFPTIPMFPGHDMHSLDYAPSPGVTWVVCLRGLLHQQHSFPRAPGTFDSYPRVDRSVDILS
jgi:hypothetical protein